MKKTLYTFILLLSLSNTSCTDDITVNCIKSARNECLITYEVEEPTIICESFNTVSDCPKINLGFKALHPQVKLEFVDFCYREGGNICYTDSADNTIIITVEEKSFRNWVSNITTDFNTTICKSFCLDNQVAKIELISERFSIDIEFGTGLNFFEISTNDYSENIVSDLEINSNSDTGKRQFIFSVPIWDYKDEKLEFKDSDIIYYEKIELNNIEYTEVFTNQDFNRVKAHTHEIVYFNLKEGLIGVRDTLGVLWTKNKL